MLDPNCAAAELTGHIHIAAGVHVDRPAAVQRTPAHADGPDEGIIRGILGDEGIIPTGGGEDVRVSRAGGGRVEIEGAGEVPGHIGVASRIGRHVESFTPASVTPDPECGREIDRRHFAGFELLDAKPGLGPADGLLGVA